MRYLLSILVLALVFSAGVPAARAQTSTQTAAEIKAQIADLLSQVDALRAKLKVVEGGSVDTEMAKAKIATRLSQGMTGEQVRLLQELLASDPSLYPEGLVTGYYGPATVEAVKRFQSKLKLEQVGVVGPQTIARINEILSAAGVTTEIPSDLLRARVKIEVKMKDGREEVKIEIKEGNSGKGSVNSGSDDEEEDEDELEIEAEIEDGLTKVEVDQKGKKQNFTLRTIDREQIIEEVAKRLELSEAEVEAVIEIEDEDDDSDDDEDEDEDEEEDD